MNVAGAETVITMSAMVTFASVSFTKISGGSLPSGRQIAGTCLAFAALGMIAAVEPDIGGGLALCVGGTAFVSSGLPAIIKVFGEA